MTTPRVKLALVNVVWGREFCDLFAKHSVPTILAAANLHALTQSADSELILFAPADDMAWLHAQPAFRKLCGEIRLHTHTIQPETYTGSKYELMNQCHSLAIKDAQKNGQSLIFLSPDCIYSAQLFSHVIKALKNGKKAVLAPGYILDKESACEAIGTHDEALTIPEREMAKLVREHLHAFHEANLSNSRSMSEWPTALFWDLPGANALARFAHWHPLAVTPAADDAAPQVTVDYDYVDHVCERDEIALLQDSDSGIITSLSPHRDHRHRYTHLPITPERAACLLHGHVLGFHAWLLEQDILLHSNLLEKADYASASASADQFIKQMLSAYTDFTNHSERLQQLRKQIKRQRKLAKLRHRLQFWRK